MIYSRQLGSARAMVAICFLALLGINAVRAQQPDASTVIRGVDAAVKARNEGIARYTATEHYAVYRNSDETHPVAEMTVKAEYREKTGKSYTIVSQSGSGLVRKLVLGSILDEEKRLSQPGNREGALLTSANYEMKLKPGGPERLDGRECLVLAIAPRRKAPNLLAGSLWVDAKDDSIVQVQGIASKSPSIFTGPTQMVRQYASMSGFAMATQARAVSNSNLLGRTVVTIDYREYQIQLRPAR